MAAVEPEADELRGLAAYSWFAQAVTGAPSLLDDATIEMVDSFGPDRLAAAVRPWFPDVAAPAELFIEIDTSRWRRVREGDWRRLIGVYRRLEERTSSASDRRRIALDRLQLVLQPRPRNARPVGRGWVP